MSRRSTVLARVGLVVLALAVCAWYAIGVRQSRDQAAAEGIVQGNVTPTPSVTRHALDLLDSAGTLNPDRAIDLLRAQALVRAGEAPQALRLMKSVVAAEPDNVDAWIVYGFAAGSRDPAAARLARAKRLELAPPVAPPH